MNKVIEVKDKEQVQVDKNLAIQMQSGSAIEKEKAYIQLYAMYKKSIMYFVSRFSKLRQEEIDDFTQEIFIKVFEKINLYNAQSSSLSTWMFNIAKHYMIDMKRKAKYEIISIESMSESNVGDSQKDDYREFKFQFVDKHTDTFKQLVLAERSVAVHLAALRVKTELGREVIRLKYFEQFSNQEIAEQLNMNKNTVKIIALRARKEMKDMFSKKGVDFEYGTVLKSKSSIRKSAEKLDAAILNDFEIIPLVEDELVED